MNAVPDALIESQAEEDVPTQVEISDVLSDAFGKDKSSQS
jgi:hypothetical protein